MLHGLFHCRADSGMIVPEQHGTPGTDIVDVLPAICVIDIRPVGPFNETGAEIHGPESANRGIDASGQNPLGAVKQLF